MRCFAITAILESRQATGSRGKDRMKTISENGADSLAEVLWDERTTSRITGLSLGNLRRRRLLRQEPPFVKLGARVFYRPIDIRTFVNSNIVAPIDAGAKRGR